MFFDGTPEQFSGFEGKLHKEAAIFLITVSVYPDIRRTFPAFPSPG
jgi:hypothetical protein